MKYLSPWEKGEHPWEKGEHRINNFGYCRRILGKKETRYIVFPCVLRLSTGNWTTCMREFKSAEEAMIFCDECLIGLGYIFLSWDKFNKLGSLI
jgi:hypothetical protein